MKKTGIGLAVGGLILSLFLAFGGKLPALERNVKTTKIAFDKVKDFRNSRINNEERVDEKDIYQNTDQKGFISQDDFKDPTETNNSKYEPNYSRIHKNRVRDHRDFVTDQNGKVYENKPCYNCSGEGYTIFINPANGQKETNICNACDGVGQIGYDF